MPEHVVDGLAQGRVGFDLLMNFIFLIRPMLEEAARK
jgi:hypothetical protein